MNRSMMKLSVTPGNIIIEIIERCYDISFMVCFGICNDTLDVITDHGQSYKL